MEDKFKGKYFGPYLIDKSKASKAKTYLGKPRVILTLEHGVDKEIPLAIAEQVITDEKSDLEMLRENWVVPVVEDIIKILTESELGNNDLHYAIDLKLGESIKQAAERAQEIIYNKPKGEISLMDFEQTFIDYNKKCQEKLKTQKSK